MKNQHAKAEAAKLGIKYFEVSAKASPKDEIDKLIEELVDMNEMQTFYRSTIDHGQQTWSVFEILGNKCDGLR